MLDFPGLETHGPSVNSQRVSKNVVMKHLRHFVLLVGVCVSSVAQAELITNTANYTVGATIPDNDANGFADTRNFPSMIGSISNVSVTLNISGTWNGDLYGYLVHDSGFSVLLNRPGRTSLSSFGYSDAGFDVTFDDLLGGNDIHLYRASLGGPFPLTTELTGTWLTDGRNVDPDLVLDTDPRTATLADFVGLNANGDWTLFLADLGAGNESVLNSWGLQVYGVVPEPSAALLFLAGAPALWWVVRRRKA